jgi:hypothetical protein
MWASWGRSGIATEGVWLTGGVPRLAAGGAVGVLACCRFRVGSLLHLSSSSFVPLFLGLPAIGDWPNDWPHTAEREDPFVSSCHCAAVCAR